MWLECSLTLAFDVVGMALTRLFDVVGMLADARV